MNQGLVGRYSLFLKSYESEDEQREDMVRLRWTGNGSKKYDGKLEDVPTRCVFVEDLPLSIG